MIRILMLGDCNLVHMQRWSTAIAEKGFQVMIFSLTPPRNPELWNKAGVKITYGPVFAGKNKLLYPLALPALKRVIKECKPDIVHAHYATSYGLLGALSGFHPLIISVWGSDVFDFPQKSALFGRLLSYNLKKADKILSTSKIMAKETAKYTEKEIVITPFGVDTDKFKPMTPSQLFNPGDIVIGTIKALEIKYGIEYLVKAFSILKKRHPEKPLKLMIVGKGSLLNELKNLAKQLAIEADVNFPGFIEQEKVPAYHNAFSVEVFPSIDNSESFGVAVIEASACGKPVVASNTGGLPEVVEDNVTGLLVPSKDPDKLADSIERLLLDEKLRTDMGNNGRKMVEKLYKWSDCVRQMEEIYNSMV